MVKGGLNSDELAYLRDLAGLDQIHLGMCWPSIDVKKPAETRDRLIARGMARIVDTTHPAGDVVELTTKGHRTLQRVEAILARV